MKVGDKVKSKVTFTNYDDLGVGEVIKINDPQWLRPILVQFRKVERTFYFNENELEPAEVEEEVDQLVDDTPVAYISGPMTGKPDHNFPRFYEVEEIVESMGYEVINPARMDDEDGFDHDNPDVKYADLLKRDLDEILGRADVVIVFDDWSNSRGATNEAFVASIAGIDVKQLDTTGEETTLVDANLPTPFQAKEIVLGARRYDYGHPYENFQRIARLWDAWLAPKLVEGAKIDIRDVAMMMIQVKQAREQNVPKMDNIVDIEGYAYAYQESLREIERQGGDLDDFLSDGLAEMRRNAVDGAFE